MTSRTKILLLLIACALVASVIVAKVATRQIDEHLTREPPPVQPLSPETPQDPSIVISVTERKLTVMKGGNVAAVYPIAVGKPSTPTPLGQFHLTDLESHPGPAGGAFGARWMEFYRNKGADGVTRLWGIHGTNEPAEIGDAVSHGCIRMRNEDVKQLFDQSYAGEPVEIKP